MLSPIWNFNFLDLYWHEILEVSWKQSQSKQNDRYIYLYWSNSENNEEKLITLNCEKMFLSKITKNTMTPFSIPKTCITHMVKPLHGFKVNSAFQPSKVDKISGDLLVKSDLSPWSGSLALRQLNPIYKKGS